VRVAVGPGQTHSERVLHVTLEDSP